LPKRKTGVQGGDEELEEALLRCVARMGKREKDTYILGMLRDLVRNNSVPLKLLESVPADAKAAGKTRFDQVYDAAMVLAFPVYDPKVREALTGDAKCESVRAWRVTLPKEYGVTNVTVRAGSFQEAFAMACDYACRVSLRVHRRIPDDLTVRVKLVSNQTLKRFFDIRSKNKMMKRAGRGGRGTGRTFTMKQVMGARLAALGHPKGSRELSVAKYVELKDLAKVRKAGKAKVSSIVTEHFMEEWTGLPDPPV
jgi:hypothetical protein